MKSHHLLLTILPVAYSFTHPGLLVSDTDLVRLQQKVDAQLDPWISCWDKLTGMASANVPYHPQAVSSVDRDTEGSTAGNAYLLWQDAAAAFALALRWKVEGNTSYADAAADILTAWAEKLTSIGSNDDQ